MNTPNESFANFLAILITVFVFVLWFIPAYIIYHGGQSGWSFLYIAIIIVTMTWGQVVANKYFGK